MFAWLETILVFLRVIEKGEDIVKTNQVNAKTAHDEQQGEQNANAKSTADALHAIAEGDRAAHDPAVLNSVRTEFERP